MDLKYSFHVRASLQFKEKCEKESESAFNTVIGSIENDFKRYLCSSSNSDEFNIIQIIRSSLDATEHFPKFSISIENISLEDSKKQSSMIFDLMKSSECKSFSSGMRQVLESGAYSDVTVMVGKEQFLAHKDVLCARSHYFNAMLQVGSQWSEALENVITLHDASPKAFAILLCHMYGVFPDWRCESSMSICNIIQTSDMFGPDDFKYIITFCLRRDLCHFFHKPCSGCIDGVVCVLLLTDKFNMPNLFDKCVKWSVKHMVRIWPTKEFAELPDNIHKHFVLTVAKSMNLSSVVDTALTIDGTMGRLPEVKWAKAVSFLLINLMSKCHEFIADHLGKLIFSKNIYPLFQGLGFRRNLVEDLFHRVISTLSPANACASYLCIQKLLHCSETECWNQDVEEILKSFLDRTWNYLLSNCYAVMHSDDWSKFPQDKKKLLTENSVALCDTPKTLRQKPVLSSSKTRQIFSTKKNTVERKSTTSTKSQKTRNSFTNGKMSMTKTIPLVDENKSAPSNFKQTSNQLTKPTSENSHSSHEVPQLIVEALTVTEALEEEMYIPASPLRPYLLSHKPRLLSLSNGNKIRLLL